MPVLYVSIYSHTKVHAHSARYGVCVCLDLSIPIQNVHALSDWLDLAIPIHNVHALCVCLDLSIPIHNVHP